MSGRGCLRKLDLADVHSAEPIRAFGRVIQGVGTTSGESGPDHKVGTSEFELLTRGPRFSGVLRPEQAYVRFGVAHCAGAENQDLAIRSQRGVKILFRPVDLATEIARHLFQLGIAFKQIVLTLASPAVRGEDERSPRCRRGSPLIAFAVDPRSDIPGRGKLVGSHVHVDHIDIGATVATRTVRIEIQMFRVLRKRRVEFDGIGIEGRASWRRPAVRRPVHLPDVLLTSIGIASDASPCNLATIWPIGNPNFGGCRRYHARLYHAVTPRGSRKRCGT